MKEARPTAVNLAWAVDRLIRVAVNEDIDETEDIRAAMLEEAQRLADEDVEINKRMGEYGASLSARRRHHFASLQHRLTRNSRLGYRPRRDPFCACTRKEHPCAVGRNTTRLQGARLSAWELKQADIPFDIIADNAAGHFMRTGQVNIVLVGSDRTAGNGDVANKIGTYKLAVVAKENGIPFYPVVPTSTVDLSLNNGDEIPIEERDASEVIAPFGKAIAPDDYPARNPAFDVTPHRYVTGIVTENGIVYPPFDLNLRRAVEGDLSE